MIIYVGGVNGVGKSTLLESVTKENPMFQYIKGSSLLMLELDISQDNYDELRKVSDQLKNDKFGEAIINQAKKVKEKVLLVDAHYLNLIEGKIHRVIDYWIKSVDGIILIEAPVESIINRIEKDSQNRDRKLFRGNESHELQIKDYILKTSNEFDHISHKYELKHLIINNPDGDIEIATTEILNFIESLRTN